MKRFGWWATTKRAALGWYLGASVLLAAAVALAAGVVVEDFKVVTLFGRTTSGVHDKKDEYKVKDLNGVAELMPVDVTEVASTAGNFFNTVSGQFTNANGWTYQSAANPLSAGTLKVHTYDVQGTATRVGCEFHIEYVPGATDPKTNIHWIQVVTDNHKIGAGGGHAVPENIVDIPGTATTPYYDNGYAAHNGNRASYDFYDFPGRIDADKDHDWNAVTFLVQGPAIGAGAGNITFLGPGFQWGWKNRVTGKPDNGNYKCAPVDSARLQTFSPIVPGANLTFTISGPKTVRLTRRSTLANVQLSFAAVSISISADTSAGGISPFIVNSGSASFAPYLFGPSSVPSSNTTILSGEGSIQWSTGEISAHLVTRTTASGFDAIDAEVDGTGKINFANRTILIDSDALGAEIIGVPALSTWANVVLALILSAVAALFVVKGTTALRSTPTA
jgi:hypothetical protein